MTTVNNMPCPNPNFSGLASFSSGGPRNGDSFLKPNITAPGVSIFSTGSRNRERTRQGYSGTSMASPHVAGVAALARQAHPTWSGNELAAAIVNTGRPASIVGTTPYLTSRCGNRSRLPCSDRETQAVAFAGQQIPVANFGFYESEDDFSGVSDDPRLEQGRGVDDLRCRNLQCRAGRRTRSLRALPRSRLRPARSVQ